MFLYKESNAPIRIMMNVMWMCVMAIWSGRLYALAVNLHDKTDNISVVELDNELCRPRRTVVAVDPSEYRYYPYFISLHQCNGACQNYTPLIRHCVKKEADPVYLWVFNELTQQNETLVLYNHTSCKCECVLDGSGCKETQKWDQKKCQCVCDQSQPKSCPEFYEWDESQCQCLCDRTCPKKKNLNETNCSCQCKPGKYRKCNEKGKLLNESDCKCIEPGRLYDDEQCTGLPTKWAIIIIIISFFAFFIFAFDCILFGKRTGCFYISTHLCSETKNNEERLPIKDRSPSQGTSEVNL